MKIFSKYHENAETLIPQSNFATGLQETEFEF